MVEESDSSDSWGSMLINEILIQTSLISGKKSNNRNVDHEHQLVGSKKSKTVKDVSKNMVDKRVVEDLNPKEYTGNNKFLRSAIAPKLVKSEKMVEHGDLTFLLNEILIDDLTRYSG